MKYAKNGCTHSRCKPTDKIEDLAKHASNTIPVYMPYITSYFMTRAIGDRP